jgi:3-oxoacyl-[acyl-carrier protein] reductase
MVPPPDMNGRRLLVTGAGSGIGRRLVGDAAARGARCIAIVHTAGEASGLRATLPADHIIQADLREGDGLAALTRDAIARLGGIDGFVHSAGVFDLRGTLETDLAQFRSVFDVNLTAAFAIARVCAAEMVLNRAGAIVMVSSQIGIVGHARAVAYTSSKAALNGLVRAMAVELAPHNVRVNAVAPGPIATGMTEQARADTERAARLVARIPMGRFGNAHEVADAIRFLLSDSASFITGQILCVDGGFTAS